MVQAQYDLIIAGAGPAGCAAAITAGKLGLTTALLDREGFPRQRICAGWISPSGVALCRTFGLSEQSAGAARFDGLRLVSWDLKRSVHLDDPNLSGWIVDRNKFERSLISLAKSAGSQPFLE